MAAVPACSSSPACPCGQCESRAGTAPHPLQALGGRENRSEGPVPRGLCSPCAPALLPVGLSTTRNVFRGKAKRRRCESRVVRCWWPCPAWVTHIVPLAEVCPSQKGGNNQRAASTAQAGGLQSPATASPAALPKSPWRASGNYFSCKI